MKICFFAKYPPIEGGVSSRTYWLSRALGEKGVEVHIVTDALEEQLYRGNIDFEDINDLTNYQPQNVYVHSLDEIHSFSASNRRALVAKQSTAWRLASLGIETIKRYHCDVIDSHYYLPYGLAAYLAKTMTGRPLILRHAGSDIAALSCYESFHIIFQEIFKTADLIFSPRERSRFFSLFEVPLEKFFWLPPSVDNKHFNPEVQPLNLNEYGINVKPNVPIVGCIGKISRFRGIYELAEAANQIKEDFLLLFVAGGPEIEQFKSYLKRLRNLKGKYRFLDFIPPWKMPALLKNLRCVANLERDFPLASYHMPIKVFEALAAGVCIIISEDLFSGYKKNVASLENGKNMMVVDPKNIGELKKILEQVIKNKNFAEEIGNEGIKIFNPEIFPNSVSRTIEIYKLLADRSKSLKSFLEELRRIVLRHL